MKERAPKTTSAITAALLALAAPAAAQRLPPELDLPWTDVAPAVQGSVVRAAAVGVPDERIGRFEPRRASARRAGRARAIAAIHAWADDALAALRADVRCAEAAHRAIDARAQQVGVRPLVDAGAVVVVEVPLAALREACPLEGAPWAR
ncbi:MAG TPA: hypothetical protein VIL20_15090 [Sandaracinaceae bacterium]